ncbi:carbohydrate kinase family protein [Actinomadura sp. KC06]|uniref:carbohydrate kinase family protein n=1 Tax=Actinomadura sp. KC06 TaxID=2530369 RepID=UPI001051096A|nr:carbohydrate kinase family protein [Actinomadura sp. KC06]TDD31998.1 carbohydrate kinase family protein [Actinomadura sp. KC06]
MKVLVLGDLCLDTLVEGEVAFDSAAARDGGDFSLWTPLFDAPGGTAYHFAAAALRCGHTPVIVGAVGADVAGRAITAALTGEAIGHQVAVADGRPTGRTVIGYSATGARVMFASQGTANEGLSGGVVEEVLDALPGFDAVWVSGLSLSRRATPTYASVREIASGATARGVRLLLDVVPHEFHRHFSDVPSITAELGPVHGLVSELTSARRLLGLGEAGEALTDRRLDETAGLLLEHVAATVLRYRTGSLYRQSVRTRGGLAHDLERPVPDRLGLRGYGDTMTCEVLAELVGAGHKDTTTSGKIESL